MSNHQITNGREEACKTYIEQTKLLVTLSSVFIIPPAALTAIMKTPGNWQFLVAELCFVASVLAGYFVFASIAGGQHKNIFDVYRLATRILSGLQIVLFLAGLIFFVVMIWYGTPVGNSSQSKSQPTCKYLSCSWTGGDRSD